LPDRKYILFVGRIDAGALLILPGFLSLTPLSQGAVARWIIATTGREVFESHEELMWREKIVCGDPDHNEPRGRRKLIHTNIKLNYFAMTASGPKPTCLYVRYAVAVGVKQTSSEHHSVNPIYATRPSQHFDQQ
jgi:hypothetical protein